MRYIRNLKNGHVRIAGKLLSAGGGSHTHESVQLEPEVFVTEIDPKTKQKKSHPGQNVAMVADEWFSNIEFTRSHGILFEEIDQDLFEKRQDVIDSYKVEHKDDDQYLPGFKSRDDKMKLNTEQIVTQEDVVRIPMDPDTLAIEFVGAEHATRSRPDPAEGGKSLSELSKEVRRSTDAPAKEVDPSVIDQMGKGSQ